MGMTRLAFALSAILPNLASCRGSPDESKRAGEDRIGVYVTIAPQAFFAERVAGPRAEVHVLVEPGQSYHTFEPTPRQVAALAKARFYFGIGIPIEDAIARRLRGLPGSAEFIDTGRDVPRLAGGCTHDHGGDADAAHLHHEHDDGGSDPHIWMDPRLVKLQCRTMAGALKRADPTHAAEYERRLGEFEKELDTVDGRIRARLAPFRGRSFFVYHPSFGYFADAYGLVQTTVEVEGKEPGARLITEFVQEVRRQGARVLFTQPQFASPSIEAIARETGARLETIDPLSRDYLANLERIAELIAASFEESGAVEAE